MNVGITGHRACILPTGVIEALELVVYEVLRDLRQAALRIQQAKPETFGAGPAQLRLHTALASGAVQLAAKHAHAGGYQVRALLPFAADDYRKDFIGDELGEFDRALDAACPIARPLSGPDAYDALIASILPRY